MRYNSSPNLREGKPDRSPSQPPQARTELVARDRDRQQVCLGPFPAKSLANLEQLRDHLRKESLRLLGAIFLTKISFLQLRIGFRSTNVHDATIRLFNFLPIQTCLCWLPLSQHLGLGGHDQENRPNSQRQKLSRERHSRESGSFCSMATTQTAGKPGIPKAITQPAALVKGPAHITKNERA
jgi:hypothetical protein